MAASPEPSRVLVLVPARGSSFERIVLYGSGPDQVLVGRSSRCQVRLPLATRSASRLHATITYRGDTWYLTDESRRGTYLQGQKLSPGTPRAIRDGDSIRCGECEFLAYTENRNVIRISYPSMSPPSLSSPSFATSSELPRSHRALAQFLGARGTLPKFSAQRCEPVERTLEKARRAAPQAGVTRVANVTGLDRVGLPVVAVYRPNARSLAVSQGKGLDLPAATASGLMEALESYCAEHTELSLRLATHRELAAREPVVDVAALPRAFGRELPASQPILWTSGRDLVRDTPRFVPFELVHTNFTRPLPSGSGSFLMSSNGLASGNTALEAISHAICELVERDCTALFAAGGGVTQRELRVDLASVRDPDAQRVIAQLEAAELAVGVWDVTSEIGLAAFSCVIVDRRDDPFHPMYYASGAGCHPQREVALLRALTEAAQCRLTYIAGARDDGDRDFFERARDPERLRQLRELLAAPLTAARSYTAAPDHTLLTVEGDVAWQLSCLQRAGFEEVVALELTKPELDIPVVRVIIPGLESVSGAPGYTEGARARARRAEVQK